MIRLAVTPDEDGYRVEVEDLPGWSTWVSGDVDRAIAIGTARALELIASELRAGHPDTGVWFDEPFDGGAFYTISAGPVLGEARVRYAPVEIEQTPIEPVRVQADKSKLPVFLPGVVYLAGDLEEVGSLPVREEVGIGVINPRGLSKLFVDGRNVEVESVVGSSKVTTERVVVSRFEADDDEKT